MDLFEKMATYVRVLEVGSFSAAAKQLKLTSGAVSRQVAALEAELRVTLLARSTRSMAPTAEGHRYYEHCLRVLHEVAEAQSIGTPRGVEGIVRVSAPVSFGLAALMPHITTLRTKHPALSVELHLDDRLLDTALDGLDVLVRAGSTVPVTSGLVARKLTTFPFVMIASPAYLARRGEPKSPEALVGHDALTCRIAPGPDVWELTDGHREARVPMTETIVFRCSALQGVRDLALAGHGLALLPDWFVADDVRRKSLRPVLPEWSTEIVPVSAIYRTTQRDTPRIRAFVDHVAEALSAPSKRDASPPLRVVASSRRG
jgi:DNA-binding transcriptional LysR family regulator